MNTQQIKSAKANDRLHLILSLCIALALIMGGSALSLFQSPTAQAAVSADLVHAPNAPQASGNISMASIPAGMTGEVTVPVMLTSADDVGVISAKIHYDASKLAAKSCTNNDTGGQCNVDAEEGIVHFNATHMTGFKDTIKLNEFVFEVLETSETALSFEFEITTSASSDGKSFELGIIEGTNLSLVLNTGDKFELFLPLVSK